MKQKMMAALLAFCIPMSLLLTGCGEKKPSEPALYNAFTTIAVIKDENGCTAMQGMAVDDSSIYVVKVSSANNKSMLYRINKDTGEQTLLKDISSGKDYVDYLYHANDLAVTTIDGVTTIFVATMDGGRNALIRLAVTGDTFEKADSYALMGGGNQFKASGVDIRSDEGGKIEFLFKYYENLFSGTLDLTDESGVITVTNEFSVDISKVTVNGEEMDLTDFSHQGFCTQGNILYVPMTHQDLSVIAVYDMTDKSSPLQAISAVSFRFTEEGYSYFEMEGCGICPADGKMYFNTNRTDTSGNKNNDGVHSVTGFQRS